MRKAKKKEERIGIKTMSSDNDMYTDACHPMTPEYFKGIWVHMIPPIELVVVENTPHTKYIVYWNVDGEDYWLLADEFSVVAHQTEEQIKSDKQGEARICTRSLLRSGWMVRGGIEAKPLDMSGSMMIGLVPDDLSEQGEYRARNMELFAQHAGKYLSERIVFLAVEEFQMVDITTEVMVVKPDGDTEYDEPSYGGDDRRHWTACCTRFMSEEERIKAIILVSETQLPNVEIP